MTRTVKVKKNDEKVKDERVLKNKHQMRTTSNVKVTCHGKSVFHFHIPTNYIKCKICLGVDLEPDEWIKDSGCSKHMTGNRKLFSSYKTYIGGNVIFGSNLRGNIIGKVSIRTDHGREFDNELQFREFCNANGITHNFSAPCTPQSNGMVERKNRTLQEMSMTMLNEQSLPQKFWCNAVDTSTYILNRIVIKAILEKTPYELLRGRKPTLDYFRVFGSKFVILNTKDYLTKFDPKSYECVFLGYSQNSKTYIILNKHTRKVKESLNVTFDETPLPSKTSPMVDDDLDEEEAIKVTEKKNLENDIEDETLEIDEIVNIKESRNHPLENVLGNLNQRTLRLQAQNQSNLFCFISTIEPKNVNEALTDESWIVAMQEELNQFIANDVWELVPQPRNMTIIGTKWVFRNKLDKNGIVSQNKARLVAQGYNQQEGIDYNETYALVARLEFIIILLAYVCALYFKLFQMDLKSAFLNGFINEEIMWTERALAVFVHLWDVGKACQQALWMKQALIDYDVRLDNIPIMYDNKGDINLSKNPVQHSRTKHIEICHHFLRDNVQKGHTSIEKVPSIDNIADILTKPLKHESFNYLFLGLGMMEHIP
ncbi:retrovirus-related pol polyprotein from transposon TNT 1-94 [Tanacetum coccineum]|uniref:Retrovirus-related pol polyprotein from transposon TNT 1-94 n=1 Tax=Tanacetum coccineum TaxID=301880 RepID=A0ABQ5IMC2_9ASTR